MEEVPCKTCKYKFRCDPFGISTKLAKITGSCEHYEHDQEQSNSGIRVIKKLSESRLGNDCVIHDNIVMMCVEGDFVVMSFQKYSGNGINEPVHTRETWFSKQRDAERWFAYLTEHVEER